MAMPENMLEAGKIVAVHALKGEVRVEPWCDSAELLADFEELFLDGEWVTIERARVQKRMVIMKIEGYNTPEEAHKLIGKILYLDRDQLELEEGTYFIADLIGMKVVDADDPEKVYGTLTEVFQTGANDIYHVRFADGVTRYVPAIPQVVVKTDVEGKTMVIRPLKGLFE